MLRRKNYKKIIFLTVLSILIIFFVISQTKKEFPVKVGQVWYCSQEVIPFINNHPQDPVTIDYSVKVISIDLDGNITYSKGNDKLTLDLENFLFLYKLEK